MFCSPSAKEKGDAPGSTKRGEAPGSPASSSADIFLFFFFPPPPRFCVQKPLHFFSIFFIFSFLDIQRCQRKNKQDQREKKKEGQQAAGEEAVMRDNQQFSQVRGFLPRPPPSPPSAPPPPPRFPAPPPPSPPPIPAGTALADTTPAGAPGPR